jgi:hypothetical protein
MATITASNAVKNARLNHAGPTVAYATSGFGQDAASLSTDVILLVKVPNGAWIIDGYVKHTAGTGGSIAAVINVNVGGSVTALSPSFSAAGTAHARFNSTNLPFKVSISDDNPVQFAWVQANVSGVASSTVTWSIDTVVIWHSPALADNR